MQQFLKRAGLALLGSILTQFVIILVAVVLDTPLLALILLLPGWAVAYAGRSSDPAWGLPVMILTNAVVYAPLVYLGLYWRPFKQEAVLSIRAE